MRTAPRRAAAVLGAALALAAMATACGIRATSVPVDAGPAPARVSCTMPGATATASASASATATAAGETVRLYLVCRGAQVTAVSRNVAVVPGATASSDRLATARRLLAELQGKPGADESAAGLSSSVPGSLDLGEARRGDPAGDPAARRPAGRAAALRTGPDRVHPGGHGGGLDRQHGGTRRHRLGQAPAIQLHRGSAHPSRYRADRGNRRRITRVLAGVRRDGSLPKVRAVGLVLAAAYLVFIGWLMLRPHYVPWVDAPNLQPLASIRADLALDDLWLTCRRLGGRPGPPRAARGHPPDGRMAGSSSPGSAPSPVRSSRASWSPSPWSSSRPSSPARSSTSTRSCSTPPHVALAYLAVVPAVRHRLRRRARVAQLHPQGSTPTIPRVGIAP